MLTMHAVATPFAAAMAAMTARTTLSAAVAAPVAAAAAARAAAHAVAIKTPVATSVTTAVATPVTAIRRMSAQSWRARGARDGGGARGGGAAFLAAKAAAAAAAVGVAAAGAVVIHTAKETGPPPYADATAIPPSLATLADAQTALRAYGWSQLALSQAEALVGGFIFADIFPIWTIVRLIIGIQLMLLAWDKGQHAVKAFTLARYLDAVLPSERASGFDALFAAERNALDDTSDYTAKRRIRAVVAAVYTSAWMRSKGSA